MTDINLKLKLWLVSDAMGYVETCIIVAETEADAREIWEEAFGPVGTERSYIHVCREVSYNEMRKHDGVDIWNKDTFDQYCPF